jgi:hypothetical protein
MTQVPACPAHRSLVEAALGASPSDEILERYADEVPSCEACRRSLAMQLGVHPARLQTAPPARFRLAGMEALASALWPEPAQRWRPGPALLVLGPVALAAAILLAWLGLWGQPPAQRADLSPGPAPVPVVEDAVAGIGPGELAVPALPEPTGPEPIVPERTGSQPAPRVVQRAPRAAPAQPAQPEPDDAVATADDWPPPPFEDLRRGAPKSAAPTLRSVQLVLVGQPGYRVGEGVDLVVVASYDTPITVCVDGPERGTVWRGAVPAGRTSLTRGGQQQAFAFSAPGTYRFQVSPTGQPQCSEAVEIVEVEVLP